MTHTHTPQGVRHYQSFMKVSSDPIQRGIAILLLLWFFLIYKISGMPCRCRRPWLVSRAFSLLFLSLRAGGFLQKRFFQSSLTTLGGIVLAASFKSLFIVSERGKAVILKLFFFKVGRLLGPARKKLIFLARLVCSHFSTSTHRIWRVT